MKSETGKWKLAAVCTVSIFYFLVSPRTARAVNPGDITAAWVCGADEQSDSRINAWVLDMRMFATGTPSFALGVDTTFPSAPPYNSPAGAKVVLSLTSVGFDTSGNATTISRTVYGTQYVRQPYPSQASADAIAAASADACSGDTVPAGYADVRVALSDFVYAMDTSLSLNVSAGAVTLGSQANNAVTGLSVTNNASTSINACSNVTGYPANCSAAVYPWPIARWATVPYQQEFGSSFNLEVVGFDRHYKQYLPLSAVIFTVTDQHSHTVTATVNAPTISNSTPGDQGAVQAYVANISQSTFTAGDQLTANFKACPWVGDTCLDSSVTTGPVITAAKNAGGSSYAVSDTGTISGSGCATAATYKVLTLSGSAVATFAITYGGFGCSTTTAATTSTGGAQPGSGSGFTANTAVFRGVAGNEDVGPLQFVSCSGSTAGQCANPAAVVDPSGTSGAVAATVAAAEAAYNPTTHAGAYTSVQAAASACKTYNNTNNSHNDPGGCHIRMVTASHALTSGSDLGAQESWVVIEPFTSATPTIVSGANSWNGIRKQEYNAVTVNDAGCSGGGCYIFRGDPALGTLWLNASPSFSGASGYIWQWQLAFATGNNATAINGGFSKEGANREPWALIRGNTLPVMTPCDLYAIVANKNCLPVSYEQSASTSGAINPDSQALSDGAVVAFNFMFASTTANNAFFRGSTGTVIGYGDAFVSNLEEATSSAASPLFGLVNDDNASPTRNMILWDNTFVGMRVNACYNEGTDTGDTNHSNWFAETQWSIVGNFFAAWNAKTDTYSIYPNGARTGNWACHYHVGSAGNRFLNSNGGGIEGTDTWLGMFSGLYSNYNGAQVTGTDSKSYVANSTCTAASGNKPITGASYASCWAQTGNTGGDSDQTWTTGRIYQPSNFVADNSYSTGAGTGNGNYHLASSSSAVGLFPPAYQPLPYDIQGHPRVGLQTAGAYVYPAYRVRRTQ